MSGVTGGAPDDRRVRLAVRYPARGPRPHGKTWERRSLGTPGVRVFAYLTERVTFEARKTKRKKKKKLRYERTDASHLTIERSQEIFVWVDITDSRNLLSVFFLS